MRLRIQILIVCLAWAGVARAQDAHNHADAHADEVKLTPEAIKSHAIVIEPVKRQVLTPTFTAPARVAFNTDAMAHVGSALRGRIIELKAKVGDKVNKGDALMVVQSPELAEAQSEFLLKRIEAEVAGLANDPARNAYERAKQLHERNEGIALAEVQRRQLELRESEAKLYAAKGAATAAENKLRALGMPPAAIEALASTSQIDSQVTITAPISGQVIERETTLGELVNADHHALLILADLSTLWVIADVPEARLSDVAVGASAKVQLAALTDELDGRITYIAPSLNTGTRTASVRIEVQNSGSLRPGMFARAQISGKASNGEPVLVVPESAVLTVEGQPSVFIPVPNEPNVFAKRVVKVGAAVGGMLPILDGLTENQPVVTRGAFILKADLGKSGAEHAH